MNPNSTTDSLERVHILVHSEKETTMATSVADLIIPGAGTAVAALTLILKMCQQIKDGQDSCTRLHRRLADILNELHKMEQARRLPRSDALAKYTQVIENYLRFLERHRDKSIVSRVIATHKMMDELKVLNEEVDMLMRMLDLATTSSMMEWKNQWQADRVAQQHMLDVIVANEANVLNEVQSLRAQMEAMMQLQYHMNARSHQQSKEELQRMKKVFVTIVRTSKAGVPTVPDWFLPPDEVEYDPTPFARGSFGAVHRGVWGSGTKVVVKTLLVDESGMTDASMNKFIDEVNIWYKLHHPHVIKMFGASHVTTPPFIVCEDATHGNMASYLGASKANKRQMWRLLYQSALGLEYLHKNQVVHGDLKLNNILVGSDGSARLADFGLSAVRASTRSSQSAMTATKSGSSAGGLRWRAPECFTKRPGFEADLYSFAMCIIEAASDEPPYAFVDDFHVYQAVQNGHLPEKPDELSDEAWSLVKSMARLNPQERTPLVTVIATLKVYAEREEQIAAATFPTQVAPKPMCRCERRLVEIDDLCTECWLNKSQMGPTIPIRAPPAAAAAAPPAPVAAAPRSPNRVTRTAFGGKPPNDEFKRLTVSDPQTSKPTHDVLRTNKLGRRDFNSSDAGRISSEYETVPRSPVAPVGGLPVLIRQLLNGSDQHKEDAARELGRLALKSTQSRLEIADAVAIVPLVRLVRDGTANQKAFAALALGNLALNCEPNCVAIADAGGIVPLVKLLSDSATNEQKEYAAHAIGKLTFANEANRAVISSAGGIDGLVRLVARGTEKKKEYGAIALGNLALKNEANGLTIAQKGGIQALVELVQLGSESQMAHSALTLANLTMKTEANRIAIARAGGITPLVRLLRRGTEKQREYAALALSNLMLKNESNRVTIANAGAIPPFVELAASGNDGQKAHAALALGNLASNNGQNCVTIVQAGAVKPLIELVRHGNADHKDRAAFALGRLALIPAIGTKIADAGGKSALDELASRGNEKQKVRAKEALAMLKSAKGGGLRRLFG